MIERPKTRGTLSNASPFATPYSIPQEEETMTDPDTYHDERTAEPPPTTIVDRLTPTEIFARDASLVAVREWVNPHDHPDPYPTDDGNRHVLIVEPNGWAYIAPHHDHHQPAECEAVSRAAAAFFAPTGWVGSPPVQMPGDHVGRRREDTPGPGRYWFDVFEDGNAAIGGRVEP